jgi:hypothetical protein
LDIAFPTPSVYKIIKILPTKMRTVNKVFLKREIVVLETTLGMIKKLIIYTIKYNAGLISMFKINNTKNEIEIANNTINSFLYL